MLKIPKNVMQIGTGSPNVKLYMEDYVNTYLKRLYFWNDAREKRRVWHSGSRRKKTASAII